MADDKDLFGRTAVKTLRPILADMATIHWTGESADNAGTKLLAKATNVSLNYQQSVTRRRTLGGYGNVAILIPSQPIGSLSIQRLFAESITAPDATASSADLFDNMPGFNICKGTAAVRIFFAGATAFPECNFKPNASFTCRGTTVSGYSLQMDAESLNVVDGIQAEFLQLTGTTPK